MKQLLHALWKGELHCNSSPFLFQVIIVLIITLISACNIFKTREPESPVDTSTFPPATSSEVLRDNMITSIQQKNVQEYEKLFADTVQYNRTFNFIASYSSLIFTEWNKNSEREYFRNVITNIPSNNFPTISLNIIKTDTYRSDSVAYTINYHLVVPHTQINFTKTFMGESRLFTAPNKNNIWLIYRWEDIETHKDSSWSELKERFYK